MSENRWIYGRWGVCSMPCGGGIQTRQKTCMSPQGQVLDEKECPPPGKTENICNAQDCNIEWIYKLGECTELCNSGKQTETPVKCNVLDYSGNPVTQQELIDRYCKKIPPEKTKDCNIQPCNTEWLYGEPKPCTEPCAGGTTLKMPTYCIFSDTKEKVPEEKVKKYCEEPYGIFEDCNTQPCNTEWLYGEYSPCSKLCGGGNKTRLSLGCIFKDTGEKIPEEKIEKYCGDKLQILTQECNTQPCEGTEKSKTTPIFVGSSIFIVVIIVLFFILKKRS